MFNKTNVFFNEISLNRPLENDISTWNYELVATDSEGSNVTDNLDIHVQQHKLSRSVNHEFSIYLRIDKRNEFPTDVDWELKVCMSLFSSFSLINLFFFLIIGNPKFSQTLRRYRHATYYSSIH